MKVAALVGLLALLAVALAGCSSGPSPQDVDASGMTRAEKAAGWDITVRYANATVTRYHVTADWGKAATDGSLLSDRYKYALGLDPHKLDTDGDGLTDCQEVLDTNLSHCMNPAYTGPTDGGYHTLANDAFTAGDTITDGQKVRGWTMDVELANGTHLRRHVTADPTRYATDGALADGIKMRYGLDPHRKDSDGDGCPDALDVFPEVANATLAPGLQTFTWHGAQSARIQLRLVLGGAPFDASAAPLDVQPGGTVHLDTLPQQPHPISCSYSPAHPWVAVQAVATWLDAPGGPRTLDLTSRHAIASYDPRTDQGSPSATGANDTAAPLVLDGADATLTLHPWAVDGAGNRL